MIDALRPFLDSRLSYEFDRGPRQVADINAAWRGGLNCVALAHLAIRAVTGVVLPRELHCYELWNDTRYTRRVAYPGVAALGRTASGGLLAGDLVWFGYAHPNILPEQFEPVYDDAGNLENWRDHAITHVAVATGEQDRETGDPTLLHATYVTGGAAEWPLSRFAQHERYGKVYGVSRVTATAGRLAATAGVSGRQTGS